MEGEREGGGRVEEEEGINRDIHSSYQISMSPT